MAKLPKNPRTHCYFGCEGGPLHHFPKPDRDRERFDAWKKVLDDNIKIKGDAYIYNQLRLCNKHFEDYYISPSKCLTRNAVPTLYITGLLSGTTSSSEAAEVSVEPTASVITSDDTNRNMKQTFVEDSQSVSRGNQGLQEAAPSTVDEVLDTSVTAEVQGSLDKSPGPVEEEADAPVEVKEVCRICLAFNVKMYNIQEYNLCQMLYDITGIKVGENDGIFQYVCYECAARLSAASAFRHKALKSDGMLQRLMNCGDTIAEQITFLKENLDILKPTLTVQEVFITTDIAEEPNIKFNLIDDKTVETTHVVIKEKYKDIVKTFCDVETIDNFVPTERSLTMNEDGSVTICENIKEHESTTLHGEEDNSNAITKEDLTRRVKERLKELKCCNVPDLAKEFGVTTELVQKIIDDAGFKKGYKRKKGSPQNQRGAGKKSKVS
ncbi:uncharacterized protein LOC110383286 isoform X8 [Helicoverpa armigera]|uniref:uncharacterized protein LOC110383286 isoform X8 n=1 Tax=Helicoverpa armigera TaxID=29058 RepID=UPI003082980B